jgi:arylsulfatase A-like enzyme
MMASPLFATENGKHLFILSGQSNMANLDEKVSFVPAVEKEFGKDKVVVVKDAKGGQPISRWYKKYKPAKGDMPSPIGDLYDTLMKKVEAVTKDQKIATVTFIWMQGEREAALGQGAIYADSLKGLVTQVSAALKRDDVNVVIGRINDHKMDNSSHPHWTLIRDVQVQVAKELPRCAWVDTDDLNGDKNGIHATKEGYKTLGERFAEKAILLIHGSKATAKSPGQKPERMSGPSTSVLLIMTDEQCADALSCVGNPDLKTPNLDRLAAQGVIFQKAYTTQPLCVPYRTALQLGVWPHQAEVMVNNTRFLPSGVPAAPLLGRLVREAGYQCGYLGKMHICHLQPEGVRSLDLRPEDFAIHGYDPILECPDVEIAPRFEAFLKKHATAPFFFTASFDDPHACLSLGLDPNNLESRIGKVPTDLALLPKLPANHLPAPGEPEVLQRYWERMEQERDKTSSKVLPNSDQWSELQWRQYLWAYYRLVEAADRNIGSLLDVLEASGRAEDTTIIFTVDHGDGAARRRRRMKQTLNDEVARIPFIVSGANVSKKGTIDTTHLVSAVDIFPTIVACAGAQLPAQTTGQSLLPLLQTGVWKDHEYVVTETLFNKGKDVPGWGGRMLRTSQYKYILYNYGARKEQLFDMEADPLELNNLVINPMCRDTLLRHRQLLSEWCIRTQDAFMRGLTLEPVKVEVPQREGQ